MVKEGSLGDVFTSDKHPDSIFYQATISVCPLIWLV